MIRILTMALLATALSACNNSNQSDAEQPETTIDAPCDSLEIEMFDEAGNPYRAKVPCDTTQVNQ